MNWRQQRNLYLALSVACFTAAEVIAYRAYGWKGFAINTGIMFLIAPVAIWLGLRVRERR
jgi:hypothetical protein